MVTKKKKEVKKRGGVRPNSGRKTGTRNRKTKETIEAAEKSGVTPLEFMLDAMRKTIPKNATQAKRAAMNATKMEAAKAAAPYVHARLSSAEVSANIMNSQENALDDLEGEEVTD